MLPVRLHLDTSDFSEMSKTKPTELATRTRDYLLERVQIGDVEIGLSYHVLFELLQKAPPHMQQDRLERAQLLKDLCGLCAFAFPGDLAECAPFSREGIWFPRVALEGVEIEALVKEMLNMIATSRDLPRSERLKIKRRKQLVKWIIERPELLKIDVGGEAYGVLYARKFMRENGLLRYLRGELSRSDANRGLRADLTDPVAFYRVWHDQYVGGNPLEISGQQLADNLTKNIDSIWQAIQKLDALNKNVSQSLAIRGDLRLVGEGRRQLQKVKADIISSRENITTTIQAIQPTVLKELFGDASAQIALQIICAFIAENRPMVRSDALDLVHALYLPHTDLWRGDRRFSGLLIRNKVAFSERVVPSLAQLKDRIEHLLVQRQKVANGGAAA